VRACERVCASPACGCDCITLGSSLPRVVEMGGGSGCALVCFTERVI
jgi:hypothetical protein